MYAIWSVNSYGLKYTINAGQVANITINGTAYTESGTASIVYGSQVTVNVTTKTGYVFDSLTGGTTEAPTSAVGTVGADKKSASYTFTFNYTASANGGVAYYLVANTRVLKYTIAFNANTGSGSMNPMSMEYHTAKALTANTFTK